MTDETDRHEKPVISLDDLLKGGARNDRTNPITGVTLEKRVSPIWIVAIVIVAAGLLLLLKKVLRSG